MSRLRPLPHLSDTLYPSQYHVQFRISSHAVSKNHRTFQVGRNSRFLWPLVQKPFFEMTPAQVQKTGLGSYYSHRGHSTSVCIYGKSHRYPLQDSDRKKATAPPLGRRYAQHRKIDRIPCMPVIARTPQHPQVLCYMVGKIKWLFLPIAVPLSQTLVYSC